MADGGTVGKPDQFLPSTGSYFVHNFGCRSNQADGAALEAQLRNAGLRASDCAEQAQVVVVNTCTVTAAADSDARRAIRVLHKKNPACRIVVTGCYAQRAPEELAALEGVALILGNSHKGQLERLLRSGADAQQPAQSFCQQALTAGTFAPLTPATSSNGLLDIGALAHAGDMARILRGDVFAERDVLTAPSFAGNDRARPALKVQDGCDNRCSFCVIPLVRGDSRSQPLGLVLHQMQTLVAAGYPEIVLTGINLGRWGRDLDSGLSFMHLLRALLDQTGVRRLRLSSVEPMDWDDELIALLAHEPRLAQHAHIPLQSASDAVLRRMHRRYRPWHYEQRVERIHRLAPEAAIGADVMVGFPGETDAEFEETRSFVERLPFTYLHVFPYSERPGTETARRADWKPVEAAVTAERSRILRTLIARKNRSFAESFIGKRLSVVTLGAADGAPGQAESDALSSQFLRVRIGSLQAASKLVTVRAEALTADGQLVAQLV